MVSAAGSLGGRSFIVIRGLLALAALAATKLVTAREPLRRLLLGVRGLGLGGVGVHEEDAHALGAAAPGSGEGVGGSGRHRRRTRLHGCLLLDSLPHKSHQKEQTNTPQKGFPPIWGKTQDPQISLKFLCNTARIGENITRKRFKEGFAGGPEPQICRSQSSHSKKQTGQNRAKAPHQESIPTGDLKSRDEALKSDGDVPFRKDRSDESWDDLGV